MRHGARITRIRYERFCQQEGDNLDRTKTLFLIVDHAVGVDPRYPDDVRFLICYEQEYVNENCFHLFDEDKPAWIDHTTIPHTLMGAMINITRPWWPKDGVRICDPFCGSGTTWLEGFKFPSASLFCSDLHPFSPIVASDNLRFFVDDVDTSKRHIERLRTIITEGGGRKTLARSRRNSRNPTDYDWAVDFHKRCDRVRWNFIAKPALLQEFIEIGIPHRLIFYLVLKTQRRNAGGLRIDDSRWWKLFTKEVKNQISATELLVKQKTRYQAKAVIQGALRIGAAQFSNGCSLPIDNVMHLASQRPVRGAVDVRKVSQHSGGKFDLIVTDPPYGFNTTEDLLDMADLYAKFIPVLLGQLTNESQLVIAVPDWSHTGRRIPIFATREFITHQVIVSAEQLEFEVIRSPYAVPRAGTLFRAPFYWESERALRRAILHFRFRKKIDPNSQAGTVLASPTI